MQEDGLNCFNATEWPAQTEKYPWAVDHIVLLRKIQKIATHYYS